MNKLYDNFLNLILTSSLDLINDTLKVALVSSEFSTEEPYQFFSDVVEEVSGIGYESGGKEILSRSFVTTAEAISLVAPDVTWEDSTIEASGAIVYKDTGDASTSPLLCYYPIEGGSVSSALSTFTVKWGINGVFRFSTGESQ